MAKRDRLSEENRNSVSDKSFAKQSWKEKLATLAKPVRAGLGMLANQVAKHEMLSNFVSNKDLKAPELNMVVLKDANGRAVKDADGKGIIDHAQMSTEKMSFTGKNGKKQEVEGWVLPAKPGNPTVVFFGGSDFDRGDTKKHKDGPEKGQKMTSYQQSIKKMADEAKREGVGFVVFDYPKDMDEKQAKLFASQMQQYLKDEHNVPLNQQAYAGFSQGSFMATHSAHINPDAAGLHITSGFSSGRMAQKDGIKEKTPIIGKAVEKRQLTEVWDNIEEAQEIALARDQKPPEQRMPIAAVYNNQEDFGKDGNRHMTPLIQALNGSKAEEGYGVIEEASSENLPHEEMLNSNAHAASFRDFATRTKNYVQQQAQQQGIQQPAVNPVLDQGAQQPAVNPVLDQGAQQPVVNPVLDQGAQQPALNPVLDQGAQQPAVNPVLDQGAQQPAVNPVLDQGGQQPVVNPVLDQGGQQPVVNAVLDQGAQQPAVNPVLNQPKRIRDSMGPAPKKEKASLNEGLSQGADGDDPSSMSVKNKVKHFQSKATSNQQQPSPGRSRSNSQS
jgi:hypothetical protein